MSRATDTTRFCRNRAREIFVGNPGLRPAQIVQMLRREGFAKVTNSHLSQWREKDKWDEQPAALAKRVVQGWKKEQIQDPTALQLLEGPHLDYMIALHSAARGFRQAMESMKWEAVTFDQLLRFMDSLPPALRAMSILRDGIVEARFRGASSVNSDGAIVEGEITQPPSPSHSLHPGIVDVLQNLKEHLK